MEWINKILALWQSGTVQALVVAVLLCTEAFLGSTTLVKPGSILAVILAGIKKVLELIKIKKPS